MILSKNNKNSGRLEYLDMAKGIAIIFMLFTHTGTPHTINTLVFGFHMQLFFIIGGIILFTRHGKQMTSEQFREKIIRRIYSIGVPYLVFCFVLSVFYITLVILSGEGNAMNTASHFLFSIVSFQGVDSLWFLPCYFFAEIFTCILMRTRRLFTMGGGICVIVILAVCLHLNDYLLYWWSKLLFKFFVCYSFYYLGYVLAMMKYVCINSLWMAWIGLFLASILSLYNGFVAIGALIFNHGVLFYVVAILSTISLLSILKVKNPKVKNPISEIILFYGKNTLVCLCTNNILIEIIRLLDYKIFGNVLISIGLFGNFLFTFILLLLEVPIIKSSKGYLSVLFGKSRTS